MNRLQFMTIMQKGLYPLEAQERNELLSDYEQHFEMGLSEGKSEQEIALELGNPEDLIKEVLGDRYAPLPDEKLGSYPGANYGSAPLPKASRGVTSRFFTAIGLLFLNLILALPILATIWALWVSIAAVSVAGIIAPVLALLDFIFVEKQVVLPELFVSITLFGVGILVGILTLWLVKKLVRFTVGYINWNRMTLKGRKY